MTTKTYRNVHGMIADLFPGDKEFLKDFENARDRERITNHLFILRNRAGISQAEMAKRLGVTQSAVSKMENRADSLSFNDVVRYGQALGFAVELAFVEDGRLVDFLGSYFSRIKKTMTELQELAGDDPDITKGIMTAFATFSKSMLEDVIPQLREKAPRRKIQFEISTNPDKPLVKARRRGGKAALPRH